VNPNSWIAILTGALVLLTAYYAWSTRRMLGTLTEMVGVTRELAESTAKAYALSVAPQVECRTWARKNPEDGRLVSETTITNVGAHRVRLSRVRLETDADGELVRRFVDRWLVTNDSQTVEVPLDKSQRTKVFVHLEDVAGQSHVVVPHHDA
jgi:hypothetical protein